MNFDPCPFRFVLGGQECKCTRSGDHDVHKTMHPRTKRWHLYEFVPDR